MKQLPKPQRNLKNFILGEDAKIIDKTVTKVALTASFIGFVVIDSIQDTNGCWISCGSSSWSHTNNILMEDGSDWSTEHTLTHKGWDSSGDDSGLRTETFYETYNTREIYVKNNSGTWFNNSAGTMIDTNPPQVSNSGFVLPIVPAPSGAQMYDQITEYKLISDTNGDTSLYFDKNMGNENDIKYTKSTGIDYIGDIEVAKKSVQTIHGNHYNHSNSGGSWY